ncbi:MAG: nucleotidyltransferase family protein [Bacteroidaceae bacterium]|nr:nucleotidyltransferase family protein [Bacteroidaceae bacterium]
MNLFFELLQIAVGHRTQFSRQPSADDWQALYAQAERHTLVGIAFPALGILQGEQRAPKQLFMQWYATTEEIRRRNATLNRKAVLASQTFARDGKRSILLKGQGLALLYPDASLRMAGDIDIWVEGSRDDTATYLRQFCPNEEVVYHNMSFPALKDVEIEVHFTPSWFNNPVANRRFQRWCKAQQERLFAHRVTLPDTTAEISIPDAAFNRLYVMQHIYRHLFGDGIGLRQVLDYYYVLREGFDEAGREATLQEVKRMGMARFAAALMYVEQRVFGLEDRYLLCEPDAKEGEYLLSEMMRAGNFGKYDARIVHTAGEPKWHSFLRITRQIWHLVGHYPAEVLCSPLWRAWHYVWRVAKGYR